MMQIRTAASLFMINVRMAFASIRGSRLRSFLTMFAAIIGVASFMLVTTFFEGYRQSLSDDISSLGANLVTVTPGQSVTRDDAGEIETFNPFAAFGASTLTEADLREIRKLDGVTAAAPQMLVSGTVGRGESELNDALIIATNEDYPPAFGQTVAQGAFFNDSDENDNFVVVGAGVVEELFGGNVALGSKLQIRGDDFTILAVMEEFDLSRLGFGPDINKAVFIPLSAGKALNNGAVLIQEIDIQISDDFDIDERVAEINTVLLDQHGGEQDFTVLKASEFTGVFDDILDQAKLFSQAIAAIMLFVSAVVILLIMLIVVRERTQEIGIRKSIGATNSNILGQFLVEAVVLTWFGTIIGFIVSLLLGALLGQASGIVPVYTLNSVIVLAIIATASGVIAGILPAYSAARRDPVESLRHD